VGTSREQAGSSSTTTSSSTKEGSGRPSQNGGWTRSVSAIKKWESFINENRRHGTRTHCYYYYYYYPAAAYGCWLPVISSS